MRPFFHSIHSLLPGSLLCCILPPSSLFPLPLPLPPFIFPTPTPSFHPLSFPGPLQVADRAVYAAGQEGSTSTRKEGERSTDVSGLAAVKYLCSTGAHHLEKSDFTSASVVARVIILLANCASWKPAVAMQLKQCLDMKLQVRTQHGFPYCMWMPHGCHMVFAWLSHGCTMVVTWLSHGCHLVTCL